MKTLLSLLALTLITSCATSSDLKKHSEEMKKEMIELKIQQDVLKNNLKKELQAEMREELKKEVMDKGKEALIEEIKKDVYIEAKKELDQYKDVINKVLADKLVDQENLIKQEITKALIEGPFIPLLEEKIITGLSDEQDKMFNSKKEMFIKETVENVLKEVVGKEIGIGKDGAEILK
jgi:hypothetical protein